MQTLRSVVFFAEGHPQPIVANGENIKMKESNDVIQVTADFTHKDGTEVQQIWRVYKEVLVAMREEYSK